jgi:AAA ATPase domain
MDALSNPYTPGAGTKPPALTGRDAQLEHFELLLGRLEIGRAERSMLITGLRGVGKTVLLTTFEAMSEERGWFPAFREIRHDTELRSLMARMARRVLRAMSRSERASERARRVLGVLKAFTVKTPEGIELSIDVEALVGLADSGDLEEDLTDLLVELGQAARAANSGVVFLLDEIQFLDQRSLEALISALHRVAQRELPLTLVGGGLPSIPRLAGEAKSYAERLFRFPRIGRLDREAATDALILPARAEGIEYEPTAVARILELSEGYPYFLQEYGRHVWQVARQSPISATDVERARTLVQAGLDEGFFTVRFERATDAERRYIAAMAELGDGPQQSGQVASSLGYAGAGQTSVTRSSLIDKGLVYSPEYGLLDFTVPHFADFMRRNFPLDNPQRTKSPTTGAAKRKARRGSQPT